MSSFTLWVQERLAKAGHYPNDTDWLDGIPGPRTYRALREFQAAARLPVTGVADPATVDRLRVLSAGFEPMDNLGDDIPWLTEARRMRGLREAQGRASNPQIMAWADILDIDYPGDDTAWCGLFVGAMLAKTLPEERLPKNPLGARQYLGFGMHCQPKQGAVLVFWRHSKTDWRGHVGFYESEDRTHYSVLGGNQGDAVSVVRIAKERLLAARWPSTAQAITGVSLMDSRVSDAPISTDEA